jgi:hypothetical protein
VNFVNQLYKTNDFDFAPRLGFAWNPGGGGRTAIRGGFGLYFDRLYHTPVLNSRNNPPYRADATLGFFFGTPFTYSLGDPSAPNLGFPVDPALRLGLDPHNGIVGARVSLGAIVDPNLRQPYSENWFLGIQREISHRIVVEVNYLGSAGHHLLNITDVNRFNGDLLSGKFHGYNSSFAAMPLTESSSNSIFHGGTVQARRPFAGGFSLHGAFTFGRAIDDNDHYGGTTPYLDANNRKLDRGPAGFDVARRLSIVGLWAIPFFQNQHQFSGRVLGGWELAGTAILESGSPLTILTSAAYPRGDFNADGSNTDRPNAPPASVPRSGFSRSDYLTGMFPASVFPLPALGTDGNLGPGVFRGPGFAQVDLSLSKKFAITEALSLQLRFDAYNAFNRVNLDPPVVDLASSSFGRSLSQQTPRAYQIGARIRF